MRIPDLRYPVIAIERKIIQQSVNEAELSDSFGVQETEYVKPDFVWECCCHQCHSTSEWPPLFATTKVERGGFQQPFALSDLKWPDFGTCVSYTYGYRFRPHHPI